jgi:hypothetical protein
LALTPADINPADEESRIKSTRRPEAITMAKIMIIDNNNFVRRVNGPEIG